MKSEEQVEVVQSQELVWTMTRSRSRRLAKVQEVAMEEMFPADWQSEKDRRRLLELTGIKEQEVVVWEVVVWEVVARLEGYRGSDCTGPGPSDNTNTRNISFCFRVGGGPEGLAVQIPASGAQGGEQVQPGSFSL